jgi:hypothetical protein
MPHDTAGTNASGMSIEHLKVLLNQVLSEPDPEWTLIARSLGSRLGALVRRSGFSVFPDLLQLLTNESSETQFRAAYVFGYTVRNDYKLLDSLPILPEAAQDWINIATRGVFEFHMRQAGRAEFARAHSVISDEVIVASVHALATGAAPWIAEGLLRLGKSNPGAFAALVDGLNNPQPEIRGWCALLLNHLDEFFDSHREPSVGGAVANKDGVGQVAHDGVLSCLVDALCDVRVSDSLRLNLLGRMGYAGESNPSQLAASVATLRAAIKGLPTERARYAAIALASLVPREAQDAVPILVEALAEYRGPYDELGALGAEALVRIDSSFAADPTVVQILENQDGPEGYA